MFSKSPPRLVWSPARLGMMPLTVLSPMRGAIGARSLLPPNTRLIRMAPSGVFVCGFNGVPWRCCNMRARNFQGRMANLKSVLPPERVVSFISERWPDAAVVWATHDEEGKARHTHFVVRWPSVVRWSALADWLHTEDGHEYAAPAGSWRRSVRYLLHLDNPEKARIPREALGSCNIDESELAQLLTAQRLPILESLILAEGRPLHERFAFLVIERGHAPSEISAALRCMMDLERWAETRCHRGLLGSALPSSADVRGSAALAADDGEAQTDFPEDDFSIDLSEDFPGEEAPGVGFGSDSERAETECPPSGP